MNAKIIGCCVIAAAMATSPALAAGKKSSKRAVQHEASMQRGPVTGAARAAGSVAGGVVGAAGAVAGTAVGAAGTIATAPFNPALVPGPVSKINGPTCKPGATVTINGQKMRCQ